tara:strand:- start:1992 stop:2285 length:294 start_codon:yes stop_codon:yes gene_type:complete
MPVTNEEVVRAWRAGEFATNHRRSFYAMRDGGLWSYNLKIGQKTEGGYCILADYTARGDFKSQTTSCHVGVARRVAHQVWHPKVWEVSNFCNEEIPF